MSRVGTGQAAPRRWLAGLDGLRALAVVAVVGYHFAPGAVPGGFLGVDLFFVISGYLITRLLLDEIDRTGRLSLGDFYRRRARRLLPAVVTLLITVSTASALVWRDQLATLRAGVLAGLFYAANWWLIADHQSYFVASGRPSMLQHLWSLVIEEQFYLVWPVLLTLLVGAYLWHRRTAVLGVPRLMTLAGGAALLAVASTVAMVVIAVRSDVPYGADSSRVYYGTGTHAMGLLVGAAGGALAVRARFSARRPVLRGAFLSDVAALLALLLVVRIVLRVDEFDPRLYRGGFLAVSLLCAVAVMAVPRRGSGLGWLLDRAPLRWLGQRSYSIYLWHWPVAVVTRPGLDITAPDAVVLALRILLTLGLAEASYRFVEQPIRRHGLRGVVSAAPWRRLSPRLRARLVPVAVAAAAVVVGSLVSAFSYAPHSTAPHAAPHPGAVTAAPAPEPTPIRPGERYAPPTAQRSSTPPATAVPRTSAAPHPSAANRDGPVSAFGDSVLLGAAPALRATVPDARVDAVEGRQARAVFADIAASRAAEMLAPVVVIHTGNNGIISPDQLAATLRSLADRTRVVVLTDRVPRDWQDPNNAMLRSAAKQFRNVVLVDWFALSQGHHGWFYADGLHLRPPGAAAYSALIAAAVR